MPKRLTQQQITDLINLCGFDDQQKLCLAITHFIQDNSLIQCHQAILNEGKESNGIRQLTNRLRETPELNNIRENVVYDIVSDIKDKFADVEKITIDDWQNKDIRKRIVELHNYVKDTIKTKSEINKVTWSDVSKIVEYAFGSAVTVNTKLKKQLYELGYLQFLDTKSLNQIMLAVSHFYQDIKHFIRSLLNNVGELALSTLFLGLPEVERQNIASYVLLKSFWECYNQLTLHSFSNNEKIVLLDCLYKLNDVEKKEQNAQNYNINDINLQNFINNNNFYIKVCSNQQEISKVSINVCNYILFTKKNINENEAYSILRHFRNAIAHSRLAKSECANYFVLEDLYEDKKSMQAQIRIDLFESLIDEIIKTDH